MFKIENKPKAPTMVWDAESKRLLCKFVKGVFETNDKEIADKLKNMEYSVTGKADEKPKTTVK